MRSDLSPDTCLPFEPAKAKCLMWLPLAVRHKLDLAGLKLSLQQWKEIPYATRIDLVHRLPDQGFSAHAVEVGARVSSMCHTPPELSEEDIALELDCEIAEAREWLDRATAFAKYALSKRIAQRNK